MMATELKPCPFCGDRAMLLSNNETFGFPKRFFVACAECGIETPRIFITPQQAIAAWNRREEDGK